MNDKNSVKINFDDSVNLVELKKELVRLQRLSLRRERDLVILTGLYNKSESMRRSYEKEVQLKLLYNDLLLKNSPSLAFIFDRELRLVLASQATSILTRESPDKLWHCSFKNLFSGKLNSMTVDRLYVKCLEVLAGHPLFVYDKSIELLNAETIHVHINIGPVSDEYGQCHGVIVTISNVSDLVEARRRAENGARSKGVFLANMSHEIRTPMNAIKGFGEILAGTDLDEQQKDYVENIIGATDSLITIINDILDFSKIDAGKMEIVESVWQPAKLLKEVINIISLKAEEKDLLFLVDVSPDIPASLVGDDARFRQIIINLLSNAIKYTKKGQVDLRVSTEIKDGQLFLLASVTDTGIGIKEEDQSILFDAFSRVDLKANRNIIGTGLGLAISRQLAFAMGGDISVSSQYGQGSTFTLVIPQKSEGMKLLGDLEDKSKYRLLLLGDSVHMNNIVKMLKLTGLCFLHLKKTEGRPELLWAEIRGELFTHCLRLPTVSEHLIDFLKFNMPDCRFAILQSLFSRIGEMKGAGADFYLNTPLLISELLDFINQSDDCQKLVEKGTASLFLNDAKILVVDDNDLNRLVCEKFLIKYGANVTGVPGGAEALTVLKREKFELVFLDHMMPEMDGLEVVKRLRAEEGPNKCIPVVALTANVVNDMRNVYLESGMNDMVSKPIEQTELVRVLIRWLPSSKVTWRH